MAATIAGAGQRKERVTISVDAELLHAVDTFVEESKVAGISRSSVIEKALHLWKQQLRDQFDTKYYTENAKALKDKSWSAITEETAKHIWNKKIQP